MSDMQTLARPYAAAIFKRAEESSSIEQWSNDLVFLSAVLNNKEFAVALNNPKINKLSLLDLILAICQDQVQVECENLLKLLVHNNRLVLLPVIAELFESYKASAEGYVDVDVSTAYPFSSKEQQDFANMLEKALKKKVNLSVTVDKTLLGGVLIRAGDEVIDGSIKGQLQQMRKALQ